MQKILIVDDLEDVRGVISLFFSKKGFETYTAKDLKETVDIVKSKKPNLAILDMKLVGYTGIELIKKIREVDKEIKLIMVSGSNTEHLREKVLSLGASSFVQKSAGLFELYKEASEVLGIEEQDQAIE